jgi:hypothetical protein
MNLSFADTFLRVQRELASDTKISQLKAQVENQINRNEKINMLNINILKK